MRAIVLALLCLSGLQAEWHMFSDGVDTYIYSERTGEVFIRTSTGGKKYEDLFVKMPRGVLPQELTSTQPKKPLPLGKPSDEETRAIQKQAEEIKKEVYKNVLE